MIASEVRLIRESRRELYCAHRPPAGIAFMLIGMEIVYFFSFSGRVSEPTAQWIFSLGGAYVALIGVGLAPAHRWNCFLSFHEKKSSGTSAGKKPITRTCPQDVPLKKKAARCPRLAAFQCER